MRLCSPHVFIALLTSRVHGSAHLTCSWLCSPHVFMALLTCSLLCSRVHGSAHLPCSMALFKQTTRCVAMSAGVRRGACRVIELTPFFQTHALLSTGSRRDLT
jgi:hypothetical protein